MIADTSYLIDLIRRNPDALAKANELESRNETIAIAAVSLFELHSGLSRSKYPEREKAAMLAALKGQHIIPLEEEQATFAGELHGRLHKQGTPLGIIDCLIAGIAKAGHDTVLTRNVKDFKKVSGLLVETY
jgi:tRNA(fMet)-specific endonuclease VapC